MPNIHLMHLDYQIFEATRRGEKILEVRLNDEKRRKIKVGDIIQFERAGDGLTIQVFVAAVRMYENLADLVAHEDLSKAGGIYKDQKDWKTCLQKYYSQEKQNLYGVVVFELSFSASVLR